MNFIKENASIIVVESVEKPEIWAILRSCEAFGIDA